MGIDVGVEEPDFVAVGEEHERHTEEARVVLALILRSEGSGARALGFEHRQRASCAVAEHVVGTGSIRERMLEQHRHAVRDRPADISE